MNRRTYRPVRKAAALVCITGSALFLSACTEDKEHQRYGALADFCADLDYTEAADVLPSGDSYAKIPTEDGLLHVDQGIGILRCGDYNSLSEGFGFQVNNRDSAQTESQVFIADESEYQDDLDYIYPLGMDDNPGNPLNPEVVQVASPEIADLELGDWEQASYVRHFQGGDTADTWDPDMHGMILYFSLQDSNLTIDFTLRLGDDGSGADPETEPYLEMMTGIADQIADKLRQTES